VTFRPLVFDGQVHLGWHHHHVHVDLAGRATVWPNGIMRRGPIDPAWVRQTAVAARTGTMDDLIHTRLGQRPFRGLP
jgi:hypothetical protein